MTKFIATLVLGASLCSGVAGAAERTVCFDLMFREGRTVGSSSLEGETGNKRGLHANNTPTPAVGHLYELWDKDADGTDKFIGRFVKTIDGRACSIFEWENAAGNLDEGEANPDVYVKYINEVRHTGLLGDKVRAVDEAVNLQPVISWRNGTVADPDAFVAVNCLAGVACDIAPGANLAITAAIGDSRSDRVLSLDTAQRALETFNAEFDGASDGVIDMIFPCVPGTTPGVPINQTCPGGGSAVDRETYRINNSSFATNGRSSAHELGHILMMVEFGRDSLAFDYSLNGPSWSRTVAEFESAAVMEAWADFAAAASWWDDQNTGSLPQVTGILVETAAPFNGSCSANAGIEIQAVKGFWDLIDANNEAGAAPASAADTFNTTPRTLSDGWDAFPAGSGNRQDNEPDGGDSNGRNLRDYFANNDVAFGAGFFTTLLNHNCTGSQDDN